MKIMKKLSNEKLRSTSGGGLPSLVYGVARILGNASPYYANTVKINNMKSSPIMN